MATEKYKIDGWTIPQPDGGLEFSFETTYASDATRVQSGPLHATPMFTAEAYSYTRGGISVADCAHLLQLIVGRNFSLHYFSPYYGTWRDGTFYVGKSASIKIGELDNTTGLYDDVSFQMTGVDPI